MKRLIIFIIAAIAVAFALQNFTSFKAVDFAKSYWQKIDWGFLSKINVNVPYFNEPRVDSDKMLNVFIRETGFVPNYNQLKKGAKVIWYNEDGKTHSVTGDGWESGNIESGKAWNRTFDAAGTYEYHCQNHPNEKATIIIAE